MRPQNRCRSPQSWILLITLLCFPAILHAEKKDPLLELADQLFAERDYQGAAVQYQSFIENHPDSPDLQNRLFQLGESLREGGQLEEARQTFERIVGSYKKGNRVCDAAYRLGVLSFNAHDFRTAVTGFELASRKASSDKIKYQAKYFNARALQILQKHDLALALYSQLLRNQPGSDSVHYLEKSQLEIARIHSFRGENEKALEHLESLINVATVASIKEEAIVRSSLAAVDAGYLDKAEVLLKYMAEFPENSQWRKASPVSSIFIAYGRKDYDRVISIYNNTSVLTTAGEFRPRVLFMVAEAYRETGDLASAKRLYSLIEGKYQDEEAGIESGFKKLNLLYQSGRGAFPIAAKKYISTIQSQDWESPFIDRAVLMLAEWHFFLGEKALIGGRVLYAKQNYLAAGGHYGRIRAHNIKPELHPEILFHQSWALLEAGKVIAAAPVVSQLAKRFPDHPHVPAILAKRGEIYLSTDNYISAQHDFELLINQYPSSPEIELAMERLGRIHAHRRSLPKMVESYTTLLQNFPETPVKPDAHFWIGVGYFDQEIYNNALTHLQKARDLDPDSYSNKAGIRIIVSLHEMRQMKNLAQACHIYIQSGRDAGVLNRRQKRDKQTEIPRHILFDVGESLMTEKNWIDAEFFLSLGATPDTPRDTPREIWRTLGQVRYQLQNFQASVQAYDHFLLSAEDLTSRGEAYLSRALGQFAIQDYDGAKQSAMESLRVVKQGRVNADSRILIGDVLAAQGHPELAIQEYEIVSRIYNDPYRTPQVIQKTIDLYSQIGNFAEARRLKLNLGEDISVSMPGKKKITYPG